MGLTYLLLCIVLISSANCQADHNSPLDQAINFHCGTSDCEIEASDAISANVELQLEGSGFHRRLHYSIGIPCLDESIPRPPRAVIIQPLPAAIYANIYELESASLAGNGPEVRLFGEVDVESIEKFAQPTALAIYHSPVAAAEETEIIKGKVCGVINISIPLHGRYPRALSIDSNNNESVLGWPGLLKGLLIDIKLQKPIVLVQSTAADDENEKKKKLPWRKVTISEKKTDQLQRHTIVWSLPAGNMRLQGFTAAVTAAVVCAAAVVVVDSIQLNPAKVSKRKKRM